jgi:hypothetical protein
MEYLLEGLKPEYLCAFHCAAEAPISTKPSIRTFDKRFSSDIYRAALLD